MLRESAATVIPARGAEQSTTPDLSVVVPSVNGLPTLLDCLTALQRNSWFGVSLEILVVDRCGPEVRRAVRAAFPDVIVLQVPPSTSIPGMRAFGISRARAEAVAVIEDHVLVPRDWTCRLLDALEDGYDVVGGTVDNGASERTVDWAAFLCEYSHIMPPLAVGEMQTITGNNVVYRRAVLERHAAALQEERWEDHLHEVLRRGGAAVTCRPEICVQHKMHYRVHEYLAQRYLYARTYAGRRRMDVSLPRRLALLAGTAVLPVVLLCRITRRILRKGRARRPLLRSLPLLVLFVCAWAIGEAVGYAAGPGDAFARVR